jgi:hypothetical protein
MEDRRDAIVSCMMLTLSMRIVSSNEMKNIAVKFAYLANAFPRFLLWNVGLKLAMDEYGMLLDHGRLSHL